MAGKPLTSEAVALTEKKMDMALDDIIKMSKNPSSKNNKQRVPNISRKVFIEGNVQRNSSKVRRYLDSRSSLRQGSLGQRRSNFQGNQFPVATVAARRAAAAPIQHRAYTGSRMVYRNSTRVGARPIQMKAIGGRFAGSAGKKSKIVPKQKPHTLDALFANMKEQRMKVLSGRNHAQRGSGAQQKLQGRNHAQRGGGAQQKLQGRRNRFGN